MPMLLTPTSLEQLAEKEPAWLRELRTQALKTYQNQPFPTSRDEHWRRTDPERVRAGEQAALVPDQLHQIRSCGGPEHLPAGVVFEPMGKAPEEGLKHLLWQMAKPDSTHAALNAAFWNGGTYLHVPKDTSTGEGYLEASYRYQGGGVALTHSLIKLERHSRAVFVEKFEADDQELLAAPVVEIDLQEGSHLTYVFINQWGSQTNVVPRIHARLGKDSNLQMLFVGFGSALTKCFVECDLVGQGSRSEVLGLVLGRGRQHYDMDAQQNHRVGNTVSDVLFHVALTDRARSVFAGNILCEPGAQKIDGYQQNRNLLLSSKARADSMPRLEIEANDVRCTHGASFTTYDQGQKFYLETRGLTGFEAERLLVTGFFATVVERLQHPALVEWLLAELEQRLEAALFQS